MMGLQAGDFRRILDFVSSSFFDVVPAKVLWSQGRALMASRRDERGLAEHLEALEPVLQQRNVGIEVDRDGSGDSAGDSELSVRDRGQAVLRLYFAQLRDLDSAALDIRHARFVGDGDRLRWNPRPLMAHWDPDFLAAIRDLYTGFYRDDRSRFEDAGQRLGLTPALDLFVEHFGPGDQRSVTFELEAFKESFHAIFVRCKDEGVSLAPGFIPLGAYLGALYEHLSRLETPLDVRGAFEAVWEN